MCVLSKGDKGRENCARELYGRQDTQGGDTRVGGGGSWEK